MSKILDVVDADVNRTVVTFKTDELTANCPFSFGGPDFYETEIRYEPSDRIVESKSLKLYFESYRDAEITAEDLANSIHADIVQVANPNRCYVKLTQQIRGGIETIVEVGDHDLS